MTIKNYNHFKELTRNILKSSVSDEYAGWIMNNIIGDVMEDVEVCADENYNEDDIRLAIGRVLCDRFGIQY